MPALGFDPDFLPRQKVPLPEASPEVEADIAATVSGAPVAEHTHFTLAMSTVRRLCRWVAWNVDGAGLLKLSRSGIDFELDPNYTSAQQIGDELYAANDLDRGHIARRSDLLWGPPAEAARANRDSFRFTNITPQLADFNQSTQNGLWGQLEDAIYDDVEVQDLRLSVFAGPILTVEDFPYRDVLVPRSFWKLIAYVENDELRARAFVLTQENLETKLPVLELEEFKLYQLPLPRLTKRIGLAFPALDAADTSRLTRAIGEPGVRRIHRRGEIAGTLPRA